MATKATSKRNPWIKVAEKVHVYLVGNERGYQQGAEEMRLRCAKRAAFAIMAAENVEKAIMGLDLNPRGE
jgi:hypothetical protein